MDRAQLSDKLKLRFLQEIRAKKKGDPESKEQYEWGESNLIAGLSNIELKEKMLNDIDDPYAKLNIICTFDKETLKRYIDSIKDTEEYKIVLKDSRIPDDLFVEYFLELPQKDADFVVRLSKVAKDEVKIKYIDEIEKQFRYIIISSFKSDELKEEYLQKYWEEMNEFGKAPIIAKFKSDELREKYLAKIDNRRIIVEIIASFESDELKEQYLNDEIEDSFDRFKIINTFKSDSFRKRYLEEILDEDERAEVVANSRGLHNRYLSEMDSVYNVSRILIKHPELDERSFEQIQACFSTNKASSERKDHVMANVIRSAKREELSIEFLHSLPVKRFKRMDLEEILEEIVEGLESYEDKMYFSKLLSLKNEAKVVASITGEEKDFPAETIALLGEETSERTQAESDLGGLSIEELRAMQQSNEAEIESNDQEIERQQLLNTIRSQRAKIKEQKEILNELTPDKKKEEVGGGDE